MIRVIHSNPVWLPQTQTWLHTQIRHLPADRIESHVVCDRAENLDQFSVANLHDFASAGTLERLWDRSLKKIGLTRHLAFLARVARRYGAKVVHSHFGDVGWRDLPAVRSAGCRHVVTFYGYDMSALAELPIWRSRYAELFGCVDLVLCEGSHMAQRVAATGCPAEKIRVHHLGVPLGNIAFRPRQWRRSETLKVLIAATFTEKKGITYALRALSRVQRDVDLAITIIGDARKESTESLLERDRIQAVIEDEKLSSKMRMLGYRPHSVLMREAYGHHLFLSPSVTASDGGSEGGLPVTIIEMLASGMPVVSTRHCDIPEVVRENQTGFLANERDVDDLTEQLRRALAEAEGWPQMMANARKLVETEFNAAVQGERLASHYESLVTGDAT